MLDASAVIMLLAILLIVIWVLCSASAGVLTPRTDSFTNSSSGQGSEHNLVTHRHTQLNLSLFPAEKQIPTQITATHYKPEHLEECKTLFREVEASGKVPYGFIEEFCAVLEKEHYVRYLLWHEGTIVAFGALALPAAHPPEENPSQRIDIFTCCFGIVDPAWQGQRLGRVLLALRVIEVQEQGGNIIVLTATDSSKSYYEMHGFKFRLEESHSDENGAMHHPGYVTIPHFTGVRLKRFLAVNEIQIPAAPSFA